MPMPMTVSDEARSRIQAFMSRAAGTGGQPVPGRWLVSGTETDGVSASYSDADDVIEFGLLSRVGGEPTNVLNVSLVLDGDEASILSVSDARSDLNFTASLKLWNVRELLSRTTDYFTEVAGSRASA